MSVDATAAPEISTDLVAASEAAPIDSVIELVKNFGNGNPNFNTSMTGGTIDDRMSLFGALSDPVKVSEHLNKEIKLVDWVVQATEMPVTDHKGNPTGELVGVTRVTLIDKDGTAYVGTSNPLADAVDTLIFLAGAGWNAEGKHLSVMVKEVTTNTAGRKAFRLVPFKSAK